MKISEIIKVSTILSNEDLSDLYMFLYKGRYLIESPKNIKEIKSVVDFDNLPRDMQKLISCLQFIQSTQLFGMKDLSDVELDIENFGMRMGSKMFLMISDYTDYYIVYTKSLNKISSIAKLTNYRPGKIF